MVSFAQVADPDLEGEAGILLITEDRPGALEEGRSVEEARRVAEDILRRGVAELEGATLTWSATAGCPCGCLPGFLVTGRADWIQQWGNARIGSRDLN